MEESEWVMYVSPEGWQYYFNHVSGESSWEPPLGFSSSIASADTTVLSTNTLNDDFNMSATENVEVNLKSYEMKLFPDFDPGTNDEFPPPTDAETLSMPIAEVEESTNFDDPHSTSSEEPFILSDSLSQSAALFHPNSPSVVNNHLTSSQLSLNYPFSFAFPKLISPLTSPARSSSLPNEDPSTSLLDSKLNQAFIFDELVSHAHHSTKQQQEEINYDLEDDEEDEDNKDYENTDGKGVNYFQVEGNQLEEENEVQIYLDQSFDEDLDSKGDADENSLALIDSQDIELAGGIGDNQSNFFHVDNVEVDTQVDDGIDGMRNETEADELYLVHTAIENLCFDDLQQQLVTHPHLINATDSASLTPLQRLCSMELKPSTNASINSSDGEDIRSRYLRCIQLLLDSGADCTVRDRQEWGRTVLHKCVARSHPEAVQLLLSCPQALRVQQMLDDNGDSALQLAAKLSELRCMQALVLQPQSPFSFPFQSRKLDNQKGHPEETSSKPSLQLSDDESSSAILAIQLDQRSSKKQQLRDKLRNSIQRNQQSFEVSNGGPGVEESLSGSLAAKQYLTSYAARQSQVQQAKQNLQLSKRQSLSSSPAESDLSTSVAAFDNAVVPDLPEELCWTQYLTDGNIPYYHNWKSGKVQWQRPESLPALEPSTISNKHLTGETSSTTNFVNSNDRSTSESVSSLHINNRTESDVGNSNVSSWPLRKPRKSGMTTYTVDADSVYSSRHNQSASISSSIGLLRTHAPEESKHLNSNSNSDFKYNTSKSGYRGVRNRVKNRSVSSLSDLSDVFQLLDSNPGGDVDSLSHQRVETECPEDVMAVDDVVEIANPNTSEKTDIASFDDDQQSSVSRDDDENKQRHLRVWNRFFENAFSHRDQQHNGLHSSEGSHSAVEEFARVAQSVGLLEERQRSGRSSSKSAISEKWFNSISDGNYARLTVRALARDTTVDDLDPQTVLAVALVAATMRAEVSMCVQLMLAGADPFLRDPCGRSAVHYACRSGCAQLLAHFSDREVESDSPWEAVDLSGRTPLHVAAMFGQADCVRYLLESAVEVDRRVPLSH